MGASIKAVRWKSALEVLAGGEASHFTPWLAENLDLLGAALELDGLVLESTEKDIAGKRLDILAAVGADPAGKTVGVAIENQYGTTDHTHLGQLLVYVAGVAATYERVLAVWLVDHVHPAHEAAIELLNRETTDRLGFVLARTRFVHLGDVDYGVDFDIIVRPNEFIRNERKKTAGNTSARGGFLQSILDLAKPGLIAAGFRTISSPTAGYSADVSWGSSKWRINIRSSSPTDGLLAMIYVNGFATTTDNEAFLARLTIHSDLIEQQLTSPHHFEPIGHQDQPLATKAAFAVCSWPGFGYDSDVKQAADRIVEFGRGVAAAAKAAGL